MMQAILSSDIVQLTQDLPALALQRGSTGIVRTAWLYPNIAFEVEFRLPQSHQSTRVLLLEDQVRVQPMSRPHARDHEGRKTLTDERVQMRGGSM